MSINDFVEMTIYLCLISFSICVKMQCFVDEYIFFSFGILRVKNFIEITLSYTVSQINALHAEIQDGCQKLRGENNFWG